MTSHRATDWLIGAAATVGVLVLALAVLWWVGTRPAGDDTGSRTTPEATAGTTTAPGDAGGPATTPTPPPDLAGDEVWLGDLVLDSGTVVTAGTRFRDVTAVGEDVVTRADGVVATRLEVDATVPFDVIADELGAGTVVGPADGGQARVVRTVQALGRELDVVAVGTVEVEAGRLVVEPTSIDIGGPDFLADVLATVARGLVTIQHDIEGLPDGLVLRSVVVQDDGFRAHLSGTDVTLVQ